jgi:hypothetical protein
MLLKLTNFRNINDRGARVALCAHPLEVTSHYSEGLVINPIPNYTHPLLAVRRYLLNISTATVRICTASPPPTTRGRVILWIELVSIVSAGGLP